MAVLRHKKNMVDVKAILRGRIYGMDNYPAGVSNKDFEDDTSRASWEYDNKLSDTEKKQVCLEYLEDRKLHADYMDWRIENDKKEAWIDTLLEYCEVVCEKAFYQWLDESSGYGG